MPDMRDDLSRRELERQIADLKRDKMRIEENIRRMEANQQRIFREDISRNRMTALTDEDKPETLSRKRSRSQSVKGEGDGDDATKDCDDDEAKDVEERKRKEVKERDGRPAKIDPRSRNIFGKLLGHLHSARSRLETEKGSKAAELHQKAQGRIEEKLSLSKMNIKEFRKSQFDQQKKEEEAKALQIDKTIEEMEMLLLQRRLESHYSLMMNFIRTKAEPTILYLPAKHTKGTEQALQEMRVAIKHKIASLKVQLQPASQRASAPVAAVAAVGEKLGGKDIPEAAAEAVVSSAPAVDLPSDEEGSAMKGGETRDGVTREEADVLKEPEGSGGDEVLVEEEDEIRAKPESEKKQAPSDEDCEEADDKAAKIEITQNDAEIGSEVKVVEENDSGKRKRKSTDSTDITKSKTRKSKSKAAQESIETD